MPGDQFQQRLLAGVTYDPKALPPAVADLESVARDCAALNYRPKKHRAGTLAGLRKVNWLRIVNATPDIVAEAVALPHLQTLFLESPSLSDAAPLAMASQLTTLVVRDPQGLESLESFSTLRQLRVLALMNAPRVRDLRPIGALDGLEAFAADGAIERSWQLESLRPLRTLKNLRQLFITATDIADGELAPLAELAQLRVLYCANNFSTAQFKLLMAANPKLECTWFDAIRQFGSIEAYTLRMLGSRPTSTH